MKNKLGSFYYFHAVNFLSIRTFPINIYGNKSGNPYSLMDSVYEMWSLEYNLISNKTLLYAHTWKMMIRFCAI